MLKTDRFEGFIGQEKLKNRLSFYLDHYDKTNLFNPMLLNASRGAGKTTMAQIIGKNLRKPFIKVNAATIKSLQDFFDQIIIPHISQRPSTLFIDEIHALPENVFAALLNICEPNSAHRNVFNFAGQEFIFDFREFAFIGATTNINKLPIPLIDRFSTRRMDFQPYNNNDIAQILENDSDLNYDDDVIPKVVSVTRKNCRRTIAISSDLKLLSENTNNQHITIPIWEKFRKRMGIKPLGLNDGEANYLKILKRRNKATLTMMAASMALDSTTIRQDTEQFLLSEGLIFIDQKRALTGRGLQIVEEIEKEESLLT
jgi:Holliday junction DNA helicase RuvB